MEMRDMYIHSDSWKTPSDNTTVMRYFTGEKFEDLLCRRQLFFWCIVNYRHTSCNCDLLEGVTPEFRLFNNSAFYYDLIQGKRKISLEDSPHLKKHANEFLMRMVGVNCWTINNKEDKYMWNNFSDKSTGVIVKSNVGRLKKAFENISTPVYMGKVRYIKHRSYSSCGPNPVEIAFLKDLSYEREKELRLMIVDTDTEKFKINTIEDFLNIDIESLELLRSKFVDCNLDYLIDEIIISPWADDEYLEIIKKKLTNSNLHKSVRKSFYAERL